MRWGKGSTFRPNGRGEKASLGTRGINEQNIKEEVVRNEEEEESEGSGGDN